jgi:hypothetical protein
MQWPQNDQKTTKTHDTTGQTKQRAELVKQREELLGNKHKQNSKNRNKQTITPQTQHDDALASAAAWTDLVYPCTSRVNVGGRPWKPGTEATYSSMACTLAAKETMAR